MFRNNIRFPLKLYLQALNKLVFHIYIKCLLIFVVINKTKHIWKYKKIYAKNLRIVMKIVFIK